MSVAKTWRTDFLDERQQKELRFAEAYVLGFNHGTDGHNKFLLMARLAELLDAVTGIQELPPPPDPSDRKLTFGKYNGLTLSEVLATDQSYVEWLSREARDSALKHDAAYVLEQAAQEAQPSDDNLPF